MKLVRILDRARRPLAAAVALVVCAALAHGQSPADSGSTPARLPLRGRVFDESGKPVDGAMVRAFGIGFGPARSSSTSARTNSEGEFVIPNLESGAYSVSVVFHPLVVVEGIPVEGARPGQSMSIRMARGAAITGKVLDRDGSPMTGLVVSPLRTRDSDGIRVEEGDRPAQGGTVDDRGVYRLWGVFPGTYVLRVAPPQRYFERETYLSDRTRTYYPGTSRANATEITVRSGDEIANADIVFRGDAGHGISGTVTAVSGRAIGRQAVVELFRAGLQVPDGTVVVQPGGVNTSFSFKAIDDGDYELVARSIDAEVYDTTDRVNVRVRGADVTGVRLLLAPTTHIAGRIDIAARTEADACGASADGSTHARIRPVDVSVRSRRTDGKTSGRAQPSASGEFVIKPLEGGHHRLWVEFGDDTAYVEALEMNSKPAKPAPGSGAATAASKPAPPPIARDGIRVSRESQIEGVRFVIAAGAARVRGRVVPSNEGQPLPARVVVCLVPADRRQADDVVHYYETATERDGTFDVRNVAPGEYFVVTRGPESVDVPAWLIFPAAWNAKERASLRTAAEKAGVRISLAPCQRLESAVVRFGGMTK